jgi:hypothetical protein
MNNDKTQSGKQDQMNQQSHSQVDQQQQKNQQQQGSRQAGKEPDVAHQQNRSGSQPNR